MRVKNYRDMETGKIYQELTSSIYYDFEKNEIIIIREPTFEEENGIPDNNYYPYGEVEILELKLITNRNIEKETVIVIVQERVRINHYKKILNLLEETK